MKNSLVFEVIVTSKPKHWKQFFNFLNGHESQILLLLIDIKLYKIIWKYFELYWIRIFITIGYAVFKIHCPAKTWIYLTPYVCTEWIFDSRPTVHVQQNIFQKMFIEVGSSHLYASFGTFCESLNIRKNSEIDDIFLRRQLIVDFQTYFKDSMCLK